MAKRKTKSPKSKAAPAEPIRTFTLRFKRENHKSVEYVGGAEGLYYSDGVLFVRNDLVPSPLPKSITFGIRW